VARRIGDPIGQQVLIETSPGAAGQVAKQAPIALDPAQPDRFDVQAPLSPTLLQNQVQADFRTTLIVLTLIAALASVVATANTMVMSVVERTSEFGLRRALGARPRHVSLQVVAEASTVGVWGGAAGLFTGVFAVLAVTLAKHWQPVLDLRLAPVALLTGAAVGAISGLGAAAKAYRLQPSEALRR
jgi:macrolide transport system ATP-binding/permease protein